MFYQRFQDMTDAKLRAEQLAPLASQTSSAKSQITRCSLQGLGPWGWREAPCDHKVAGQEHRVITTWLARITLCSLIRKCFQQGGLAAGAGQGHLVITRCSLQGGQGGLSSTGKCSDGTGMAWKEISETLTEQLCMVCAIMGS